MKPKESIREIGARVSKPFKWPEGARRIGSVSRQRIQAILDEAREAADAHDAQLRKCDRCPIRRS